MGVSDAGVFKVLKRLGFSRKQALRFIHSPDPDYRLKWQAILHAYLDAWNHPAEVVLLFQDEMTYYRMANLVKSYHARGRPQHRHPHRPGANTKARLTAVLNAVTGRVQYLQRSKVGCQALAQFYQHLRAAYPVAKRIYLVQDNWPVHKHPDVLQAAQAACLTCLFLPTYASWLNPIEKLWRWLRQDILHNHTQSTAFKELRQHVETWLDQFAEGSLALLHYVGLLTQDEFDTMSGLIC
jgi:transposase